MARARECCSQPDSARGTSAERLACRSCSVQPVDQKGKLAAFRKLSTKRDGGVGVRRWPGCGAGGGRWAIWETCQQEPQDKDWIWSHMLSLWKLLWVGVKVGEREGKGEKKRKGAGGERMSAQPGSLAFFFFNWKQTQRVLRACPVLSQRPSEGFSIGMQGDGERCWERRRSSVKTSQPHGRGC